MRIGIDLDDTLVDCCTVFLNYYNKRFKTDYLFNNVVFGTGFGGETGSEWRAIINDYYDSSDFLQLKPLPSAQKVLEILKDEHELVIVTSRTERIQKITDDLINEYFPGCFQQVFHASDRLADSGQTKAHAVTELKLDVMVEDAPQYVEECINAGAKALLFDRPWNQNYQLTDKVTRVHDWTEIVEIIDKLDRKNH